MPGALGAVAASAALALFVVALTAREWALSPDGVATAPFHIPRVGRRATSARLRRRLGAVEAPSEAADAAADAAAAPSAALFLPRRLAGATTGTDPAADGADTGADPLPTLVAGDPRPPGALLQLPMIGAVSIGGAIAALVAAISGWSVALARAPRAPGERAAKALRIGASAASVAATAGVVAAIWFLGTILIGFGWPAASLSWGLGIVLGAAAAASAAAGMLARATKAAADVPRARAEAAAARRHPEDGSVVGGGYDARNRPVAAGA
jgi:hypothetical protein